VRITPRAAGSIRHLLLQWHGADAPQAAPHHHLHVLLQTWCTWHHQERLCDRGRCHCLQQGVAFLMPTPSAARISFAAEFLGRDQRRRQLVLTHHHLLHWCAVWQGQRSQLPAHQLLHAARQQQEELCGAGAHVAADAAAAAAAAGAGVTLVAVKAVVAAPVVVLHGGPHPRAEHGLHPGWLHRLWPSAVAQGHTGAPPGATHLPAVHHHVWQRFCTQQQRCCSALTHSLYRRSLWSYCYHTVHTARDIQPTAGLVN
jgi:hypothetical protein